MKAVFLPSHFDGDGYYRLLFPARELGRRGWEVSIAPHVVEPLNGRPSTMTHFGVFEDAGAGRMRLVKAIDVWLQEQDFDVLVMQQRSEPWWPEVMAKLQAQEKRCVVDSDDCWIDLPSWNPGSKKPQADVDAMLAQMAAADAVSVATPKLAEVYGRGTVIRNRLDWPMWEDVTPAYEIQRRRVRVGWMGELQWRAGDLDVLKPWLGPWLEKHPEVEFVAAGDPRIHDLLKIPEGQRVSTNRTDFSAMDLADITATFDIGLVPLATDTASARRLNECKSHLKGMEYAACGIPCVATPAESYRWWVDNGSVGRLAASRSEWVSALDYMVEGDWRRQGQHARVKAEKSTVQEHIGDWSTFLTGVCLGVDTDAARPKVAA